MKRALLAMLVLLLVSGVFQLVSAETCVEVDIELPDTVVAEPGTFATGYFELINCGDEAAIIWLAFDVDFNGIPFALGQIPVSLGAGESISREFRFPVPPGFAGYVITICVTATSGDFVVDDCATVTIEGASAEGDGSPKVLGFSMTSEGECVEIDMELPDTVYAAPASFSEGYFELINCGDEAATITLSVSLDLVLFDTTIVMGNIPVHLGAGESISREFRFPVPPAVPNGTFGICVTATSGDAMVTSCHTIVIVNEWGPPQESQGQFNLKNYPNPFNPTTELSFELTHSSYVDLTIYNVLGQKLVTIVDEQLPAGSHLFEWDSKDSRGNVAPSGIYFFRLQVEDEVVSKKMMIVK